MATAWPIELVGVNHHYGRGALSRQILFEVDVAIGEGEIVILTGPSGSGKTTLLTLIGALRSAQDGSVRILEHELRGASEKGLIRVRRQIGYIFQQHNLIDALSVRQNVQMALALGGRATRRDAEERIRAVLDQVGLGAQLDEHPAQLSGGQKQRVGIARALVHRPRVILADEPTASLDKQSGREAVQLIQTLAREDGASVILVTHDNRILDVADRVLHLEDGRIQTTSDAVAAETSRLLHLLDRHDPDTARYLAAYALGLARVAAADHEIHEDERVEMGRVLGETAELSAAEIDLVLELALSQLPFRGKAGDAFRPLNPEQRQGLVQGLRAVAQADGRVDEAELLEIDRIAAELGFGDSDRPGT